MATIDTEYLSELSTVNPPTVQEAYQIQKELREKVVSTKEFDEVRTIGGADLAVLKDESKLLCGIIIFSYPGMEEIERVSTIVEEKFPYIPGLLAFREGPAIIETFRKLKNKPDILMIDGQGIAHPRGTGIACHVGVLLDIPSFGVAKKRLYGTYEEPGVTKGSFSQLFSKDGKVIGAVLRSRDRVKPVFVSVGHKTDLESALEISLTCSQGYRIPEPTRRADNYVAELKRKRNNA